MCVSIEMTCPLNIAPRPTGDPKRLCLVRGLTWQCRDNAAQHSQLWGARERCLCLSSRNVFACVKLKVHILSRISPTILL